MSSSQKSFSSRVVLFADKIGAFFAREEIFIFIIFFAILGVKEAIHICWQDYKFDHTEILLVESKAKRHMDLDFSKMFLRQSLIQHPVPEEIAQVEIRLQEIANREQKERAYQRKILEGGTRKLNDFLTIEFDLKSDEKIIQMERYLESLQEMECKKKYYFKDSKGIDAFNDFCGATAAFRGFIYPQMRIEFAKFLQRRIHFHSDKIIAETRIECDCTHDTKVLTIVNKNFQKGNSESFSKVMNGLLPKLIALRFNALEIKNCDKKNPMVHLEKLSDIKDRENCCENCGMQNSLDIAFPLNQPKADEIIVGLF